MPKKLLFLTLIIFSVLGLSSVSAAPKKGDVRLSEIDDLIKRTEYDQALKLLNVYIANNPENFDNAQIRIRSIINARKAYSKLAETLIQMILKEPENSKEIYEIIAQLEKYERHPSDANLQFIADVKKSAQFNYFRAVFMDIQTTAAGLTNQEAYVAAFNKVREGFWLYKDDFYERWEDQPEFTKRADVILSDLEKNIATFEARDYIPKITDAVQKFNQYVKNDSYREASAAFSDVRRQFAELNSLRQRILKDSSDFENLFEKTKDVEPDFTDASYLPFMIRYINGIDSIPQSGFRGAVDGLWDNLCAQMNANVFERLNAYYESYCNSLDEKSAQKNERNVQSSSALSEAVLNYCDLEGRVAGLYDMRGDKNPLESDKIRSEYLAHLTNETRRLLETQKKIAQISDEQGMLIAWLSDNKADKGAIVKSLFSLTERMTAESGDRNQRSLENFEWAGDYNSRGFETWNALSDYYSGLLSDVFAVVQSFDVDSWRQISAYYRSVSDSYVDSARCLNSTGELFAEGLTQKLEPKTAADLKKNVLRADEYAVRIGEENDGQTENAEDFGIVYCYPDIANAVFTYNNAQIEKDIWSLDDSDSLLLEFFEKKPEWKNDEQISLMNSENESYFSINKSILLNLKNTSAEQIEATSAKIRIARLSKNEGDTRFEEAEAAFKRQNYALARRKLQDALAKYDESLAVQDDENLRVFCDARLSDLGSRITRAENEVVVAEVRNLKTLAKDAYFNGRFDDAERYLTQAKIRWADTNVVEDEEITSLMTFVNTAVSMNTGREILPSYPQYPEMSQLLDISQQYYNSGAEKYALGNKKDGNADLDRALQSIQKVQYVYPLNQRASILTLKINKLKNPDKFNEEFSQKIEAARFMCRRAETRQEGYSNLLDYYELEPNYPGLRQVIYQTEIDIGIRQKPADNSGRQQAKNLYTEARKIYSSAGGDRAKLNNALSKINQSLALNADDKDAMKLKDQITTSIGGSASTVLSTEDERLYQLAIQRLQNNNISGANAIVSQLLKKSSNSNSQKIKDLKVKIDARS